MSWLTYTIYVMPWDKISCTLKNFKQQKPAFYLKMSKSVNLLLSLEPYYLVMFRSIYLCFAISARIFVHKFVLLKNIYLNIVEKKIISI